MNKFDDHTSSYEDPSLKLMEATMLRNLQNLGTPQNNLGTKIHQEKGVTVEYKRNLRGRLTQGRFNEQLDRIQSSLASERAVRIHAQRTVAALQEESQSKSLRIVDLETTIRSTESMVQNLSLQKVAIAENISRIASTRLKIDPNDRRYRSGIPAIGTL